MGTRIEYCRASTGEQHQEVRQAEPVDADHSRIFMDHGKSSNTTDRPHWTAFLDYARTGDTIIVRRLERRKGSEQLMAEVLQKLDERGLNIVSLTEP